MQRNIKITSHSLYGKLYVDLIPRNTILSVAVEGDDVWIVDPKANGLTVFNDFISIPKTYARHTSSAEAAQRTFQF
jgi:hypothetical protein